MYPHSTPGNGVDEELTPSAIGRERAYMTWDDKYLKKLSMDQVHRRAALYSKLYREQYQANAGSKKHILWNGLFYATPI